MSGSFFKREYVANLGFIFGCLTVPGLVATGQAYIWAGKPESFWPYLLGSMILWYYWGILTPLIFWLSRKYPFVKKRWIGSLVVHLTFWIIFSIPEVYLAVLVYKHIFHLVDVNSSYFEIFQNFLVGKMQLEIITYGCIVGVCIAFDYRKKFIEREVYALQLQMQLSKAELSALKMQLHPHFLFNTLHTVSMLIRFNENKTANEVINRLGELLRRSLELTAVQKVTLKEELELTDCYLEIERIRFQGRISIVKNIVPNILTVMVPNLILQPLVENAIRHGVSQRVSGGLIEINAWGESEILNLEIKDNGSGHIDEKPQDINSINGNGIGLANTQERLHHLYGASHTFQIFRDNGFSILIRIPFNAN